jgi:hypothetical protein
MQARAVQVLAIVMTTIALVPGGAHVLSLEAKLALPVEPYFVVQQIYRGWAWLGIVVVAAMLVNFGSAMVTRDHPRQFWLSLIAGLLIAATLAIFFTWTYPANQATVNWTSIPGDWERLRMQWEYSHAVSAALTFAAFLCAIGAALSTHAPHARAR